eukprot:565246_1
MSQLCKDGEWVDELCIACIEDMLSIKIEVHEVRLVGKELIANRNICKDFGHKNVKIYHALRIGQTHYEALLDFAALKRLDNDNAKNKSKKRRLNEDNDNNAKNK